MVNMALQAWIEPKITRNSNGNATANSTIAAARRLVVPFAKAARRTSGNGRMAIVETLGTKSILHRSVKPAACAVHSAQDWDIFHRPATRKPFRFQLSAESESVVLVVMPVGTLPAWDTATPTRPYFVLSSSKSCRHSPLCWPFWHPPKD